MISLKTTVKWAEDHMDENKRLVVQTGHLVPEQFLKTYRKHLNANKRTPAKTFRLRRSIRYQLLGNTARVMWYAPYAAAQEAGQHRGSRPYTNYTTPGTGAGFAQQAMNMTREDFMEDFAKAHPEYGL